MRPALCEEALRLGRVLDRTGAYTRYAVTYRADDLRSAYELARTQAALVYELRCAVELLEIDPTARELVADAVARFPEDSGWPELARAQALLR